jgi:hypothetical protein
MQYTTRLHDGLATPVFQEASRVVDQTVAFHPTHRVFETAAHGRDGTIGRFLSGSGTLPVTKFQEKGVENGNGGGQQKRSNVRKMLRK